MEITTPQKIENVLTTIKDMEYEIICLKRDRKELVEAINELYDSCPCDPDISPRFLAANKKVSELMVKYSTIK